MDLFVQICPDAFGGLSVFPLKKRGNGRYRVDSSSYESKVGDYQDNKTMQKNQSDIEDWRVPYCGTSTKQQGN